MHLKGRRHAGERGLGVELFAVLLLLQFQLQAAMAENLVGGRSPVSNAENSLDMENLAEFAVSEHNLKGVGRLCFSKVLSAEQQVVQGIMYYLTLEAVPEGQNGEKEVWEAKVWCKPWEKSRQLQDFKFLRKWRGDGGTCVPEENKHGLRLVGNDDPAVQEAAEQALKSLQQRSNSLIPYELQHVVSAHAEAGENLTKFELLLRVKRSFEQNIKAELQRTAEGVWSVKALTEDPH